MNAAAAFPHFPAAWPLDMPMTAQQALLAEKAEQLASWGTPPPMLDDIIALLDWYDGDPDLGDDDELDDDDCG